MSSFARRLLAWHARHGRHDLPWQQPRTPYRVWVSEIMLQQTQVATALPYFGRFMARFPTLPELAAAELDEVLAAWSGLGYYRRARFLHAAARACVERHDGELPDDIEALSALPGIGRSTAGAILAQAHGQRVAILDGNVKRVLARYHGVGGWPGKSAVERRLWELAESQLPRARLADYTQAIMDLGATVCRARQPGCAACPVAGDCVARREGRVHLLPEPPPRRSVPRREALLLVARDAAGRLLFEQRAAAGVWPGLWSLPEAVDAEAADAFATRLGLGLDDAEALEAFEHAFTHFRLRLSPLLWHGVEATAVADDARRWLHPDEARAMALPAPIRRFVERLASGDTLSSAA